MTTMQAQKAALREARASDWPSSSPTIDTPAFVRRLHREERGNIWVLLMMFYIWVILASIGFTWNTGMITSRQVHAQAVADAVVFNAAMTKARTMNMVVASNISNLQHVSADALLQAVAPWTIHVIFNWVSALLKAGFPVNPFSWPLAAAVVAEIPQAFPLMKGFFHSVGAIINMVMSTIFGGGGVSFLGGLAGRINEIHEFQDSVIEVPQTLIPAMVAAYEEKYNAEILYGDHVREIAPNEAPSYDMEVGDFPLVSPDGAFDFDNFEDRFDIVIALFVRMYRDHDQWYKDLSGVVIGKGAKSWRTWMIVFFVINALARSDKFYTINDNIPLLEFTPTSGPEAPSLLGLSRPATFGSFNSGLRSYDDNADSDAFNEFTMTAAVTFRNVGNLKSRLEWGVTGPSSKFREQFRKRQAGYLFSGLFDGRGLADGGANWDDSVSAYASAEYFNPTMNRMASPFDLPFPYRMFTTWGWNWQPRLYETHPDFIGARIASDGEHIRLRSHHSFEVIGGNNVNNIFPQDATMQEDMRKLMRH